MDKRELLLGDEAVALAALHAGISGAYAYPGTPSTELFEFIERKQEEYGVHALWSANEKVAYEEALGMSYAGKRVIVSMKHVGLNVAADPFMNSGVTGVNGGMVVCVADDPGMHSSQNEQDSRFFAKFCLIPCLEPATQQEAYDMTHRAFELSERFGLPIMLRLVTRLAHSRSDVATLTGRSQNPINKVPRGGQFTLLPSNARVQYERLTRVQTELQAESEKSPCNELVLGSGKSSLGVITSGIAHNYFMEAVGGEPPMPYLQVGQYPIPAAKVRDLVDSVDEILVIEEGYPLIEEALGGLVGVSGKKVRGKLDGSLPRTGELDPAIVAKVMGRQTEQVWKRTIEPLPGRPPALCPGCPHTDTFKALNEAVAGYEQPTITSDIGCYTLGFYPPLNAIETCVDMGASISMASGAAHAGLWPVLCALGDSTFAHSGMTGLLGAAREDVDMTVMILDNGTVAMTGTQKTLATGEELERIVTGLGVDPGHLRVITPLSRHHDENVAIIKEEIEHRGLSVIIARRACIQIKKR